MKKLAIVCLLFVGCVSTQEKTAAPFWKQVLDSIPWDNEQSAEIIDGTLHVPDDISQVMFENGYTLVHSTHKTSEDAEEMIYYVLDKNKAAYDMRDNTFIFIGKLLPNEAPIWLIFSNDAQYALFADPDDSVGIYENITLILTQSEN
jgi:hypothetical protein